MFRYGGELCVSHCPNVHSLLISSDPFLFQALVLKEGRNVQILEELLSNMASTRLSRCPGQLLALSADRLPGNIWLLLPGGCSNLCSLNLTRFHCGHLPLSILNLSLPSLTRLQCRCRYYSAQDLASPFFQSIRYLQPTHVYGRDWEAWSTSGLGNMRSLRYLAFHVSIYDDDLRQGTNSLFASLPDFLELFVLKLDINVHNDLAFDDLRTGNLHPRVVPCFSSGNSISPIVAGARVRALKHWVILEDYSAESNVYDMVNPEPFWGHGMQVVRDRMARGSNAGRGLGEDGS